MIFKVSTAYAPYQEREIKELLKKEDRFLFFVKKEEQLIFLDKFYYFFNNLIKFSLESYLFENNCIDKKNNIIVNDEDFELYIQYYFYEIGIKEISQFLSFQDIRFCPRKALASIEKQEAWFNFTDEIFKNNPLFGYEFFNTIKTNIISKT